MYYSPQINAHEAILIKGIDTDNSSALFAMHTAFPLSDRMKNRNQGRV